MKRDTKEHLHRKELEDVMNRVKDLDRKTSDLGKKIRKFQNQVKKCEKK